MTTASTGTVGFLLIVGILLAIVGFLGFGFSDPFSDPTIWYVLIGLGFFMFIVGIVYVTAVSATSAPTRR